ncbi:hypothetical protein [Zavarzinia sp. CC-PAN008]|uniref:hypothetical protein n=1 Tax=Zavarzinia sp. CC-PAN008 TaxID=3243332 RepID=UPI003F746208
MTVSATGARTIWIGLPVAIGDARVPLDAVPDAPRALNFAEAPLQADLIAVLASSPEAATLEHLFIGTSHDYARKLEKQKAGDALAMADGVGALARGHFPALRWLSLGDMELLHNGHRLLGRIGDVTHVFAAAPHLEELTLQGQFSLKHPVRHESLRRLEVDLDDIGVSGGPLSQATVTNLLSSHLPMLRELHLSLDEQDLTTDYDVPDALLTGDGMAALLSLSMDRLTPDAHSRLRAWAAARGIPTADLSSGIRA